MNRIVIAVMFVATAAVAEAAGPPPGFVPVKDREPRAWDVSLCPDTATTPYLVVRGRVLGAGERPLAGVNVYAYHADEQGLYATPGEPWRGPKYAAVLRTNAKGEYRIRTVVPGKYEGPPHVHFEVWGPKLERRALWVNVAADWDSAIFRGPAGAGFTRRTGTSGGQMLALPDARRILRARYDLFVEPAMRVPPAASGATGP